MSHDCPVQPFAPVHDGFPLCFLSVRCDTVTSAVMMQYSRDFKGHLASLFLNENIDLGKKYVFDIQRTSKEVYDHTRRALFSAGAVSGGVIPAGRCPPSLSPLHILGEDGDEDGSCKSCREKHLLEEKLQRLQEALLCALCCEEEINAAFCPCGHAVCCQGCAAQLQVVTFDLFF